MERLTKRLHDWKVVTDCDSCEQKKDKQCTFSECRASLIKRLAAYEDTGWTPEMLRKLGENAGHLWDFAQAAENMTVGRLKELAEADKDGRLVVLLPEERTLDFPVKYTEICALYHFCVDLGIKCTIERLYDGYAVRFPDGSDFAQHHGTYGGTEGCVEPAIGDSEFDYTAVGLNFALELVKKHKGKLEADKAGRAMEGAT